MPLRNAFRRSTLLAALLALRLRSADPSPAEIIARAVEAERANTRRAANYNFQEERRAGSESLTYDVIYLEGTPYRRLIARGGRPLSGAEARTETRRMERESARRKAETPAQRRRRLFERPRGLAIPFERLPSLCDLRLAATEEIAGRPAWRIEAEPRLQASPRWRQTLWIDRQDMIRAAFDAELLEDAPPLARGARVRAEKSRHPDGVWLPARTRVESAPGSVTETLFERYRRFRADSVLLPLDEASGIDQPGQPAVAPRRLR